MSRYELLHGDCLEKLKGLPDNSVDSIVCDPPYDLTNGSGGGFMGKKWDATGIAFRPDVWLECLRVLKPGGHLLAFGGTRTYHRMTCAIEDAGFEVRDSIHWVYGSGFPKSLDISKAIDKIGGDASTLKNMAAAIKRARETRGLSVQECDLQFCGGSTAWPFYEGRMLNGQISIQPPAIARARIIASAWPELEAVFSALYLTGPKVGEVTHARGGNGDFGKVVGMKAAPRTVDVTKAATDIARQWGGWGTALKPSHEPIVVARKPFTGTIAANVLEWGTGGLHIDACRVAAPNEIIEQSGELVDLQRGACHSGYDRPNATMFRTGKPKERGGPAVPTGRFPPNVLFSHLPECRQVGTKRVKGHKGYPNGRGGSGWHGIESLSQNLNEPLAGHADPDGLEAVEAWECAEGCAVRQLDEQSGIRPGMPLTTRRKGIKDGAMFNPGADDASRSPGYGDSGGASRFFPAFRYQAKAPPKERKVEGVEGQHPTQKPEALCRWLVRLVTPPNGVVLDPFTGSGTTGVAALLEGFRFIGCEREDEYYAIAKARLDNSVAASTAKPEKPGKQGTLFDMEET